MKTPMSAVPFAIPIVLILLISGSVSDANAWQTATVQTGAGQGGKTKIEPLAWRLESGQKFAVALKKTAAITSKVETRTRRVEVEVLMEMDWEVSALVDAGFQIRQTLTRLRVASGAPGDLSKNRLNYDSAVRKFRNPQEVSGKVAKQYRDIIGLAAKFTLTPEGHVLDFILEPGQEKKIAGLSETSPVKQLLSGQSPEGEISPLTNLDWSAEPSGVIKRPVKSGLGEFIGVDRYRAKDDGGQTLVEVSTSAEGLAESRSEANILRYEGQGRVAYDKEAGYVSRSARTLTIESQKNYRDMQVESRTEVRTSITLDLQK